MKIMKPKRIFYHCKIFGRVCHWKWKSTICWLFCSHFNVELQNENILHIKWMNKLLFKSFFSNPFTVRWIAKSHMNLADVCIVLINWINVSCHRQLNGQLIERVANEFNKLQFYVTKSKGLPLVEEIKPVKGFTVY